MWGSTFDDQDEDDKSVAVMKRQFLEEPAISNFTFPQPPLGIQAKDFVSAHFGKDAKNMQFRRGTTTLAFVYEPATANDQGGIVVAVDSRASSGEYISSKSVMKILDIGDHMVATMAGGAADCQFWTRTVAKYCNLFELREKTQITVAAASKYFANVLYNYRGMGLSVGSMIAGYDKRGPQIFKYSFWVDSEGDRCQLQVCSVGSGSLNAYGVLDTHYKRKMTDEEALKLGRRAIMHATYRDTGSGGVCNIVHITPKEKKRLPPIDVSKLWYEFADELGRDIVYEPRDE